jgi:glucose/arabinose dehydrogenase
MKYASILILLLAACDGNTLPPVVPQPIDSVTLGVQTVASNLSDPVHLAAPANDSRLFVVEQPGRILIIQNGQVLSTPFLDIRAKVTAGGEQGLLSVAFHPSYQANGFFYVNYTDVNGDTRVERYQVSTGNPNAADAASAKLIIAIAQPAANHNGGQLAFGEDGKLYIGMGDGGGAGDTQNHGQDRTTLLGDLLRIDVDAGDPYAIPPDNPYASSTQFRREIWASGLRNPWRFSFDFTANMIYIADVGQGAWEEINAVPAAQSGSNYGWRIMEGAHCFNPQNCSQAGLQLPVHEYANANQPECAVTGGHVYRGTAIPGIVGHYFYSDYCTGFLKSFRLANGNATDHRTWVVGNLGNVTSFGVDAAGELYILSANGTVRKIVD